MAPVTCHILKVCYMCILTPRPLNTPLASVLFLFATCVQVLRLVSYYFLSIILQFRNSANVFQQIPYPLHLVINFRCRRPFSRPLLVYRCFSGPQPPPSRPGGFFSTGLTRQLTKYGLGTCAFFGFPARFICASQNRLV